MMEESDLRVNYAPFGRTGKSLPSAHNLTVIQIARHGPGWAPINYMADLAARSFGTKVVPLKKTRFSLSQLLFSLQERERHADKPDLLLIAPTPRDLLMLGEFEGWRSSFNTAVAWIVDSFWLEQAPPFGIASKFDKIFVMTGNEVEGYQARLKRPTSFLPWGTDALELGLGAVKMPAADQKNVDLLRIGRQPTLLDDDEVNARACHDLDMSYLGRPPFSQDMLELHRNNMTYYRRSKFVLASSNLASPKPYTHPTREYVTARWTDALAGGCIVAGVPPYTDYTLKELFWPGALLELDCLDRDRAFATVREGVERWNPEQAYENFCMALERLDWRWRFKEIADFFGHRFPALESDLARMNRMLEQPRHAMSRLPAA